MTITVPRANVITVQTAMRFDRAVASLQSELHSRGFRVATEFPVDRDLHSDEGMLSSRYAILVVWHPTSASQAVLSDPMVD